MGWRYQPVARAVDVAGSVDFCVTLVEVHLKDDGTLDSWTEDVGDPVGNDIEDLISSITIMWMDAMCWKVVPFAGLTPGMSFERAVSQEVRNRLADFIDGGGAFLNAHKTEG